MRIFTGPPGTGKTFAAAREAVRIIDGAWSPADVIARHRQLVDAKRIFWVAFHPSYTYEDFVEGFRPVARDGRLTYEIENGIFKTACLACSGENGLRLSTG